VSLSSSLTLFFFFLFSPCLPSDFTPAKKALSVAQRSDRDLKMGTHSLQYLTFVNKGIIKVILNCLVTVDPHVCSKILV